jgi:radical SAM protein with 4Fe4S-binding SPASM domain
VEEGKEMMILDKVKNRIRRKYKAHIQQVDPLRYYKREIISTLRKYYSPAWAGSKKFSLEKVPFIVAELSNLCNLNCSMCSTASARRPKGEMPFELFKRIAEIKSRYKQRTVVLHTVGEPFLCTYLEELVCFCKEKNLTITTTTNGLLLHKYEKLLKKYYDVFSRINLSIDGATAQTYEKIRRGGDFNRLQQNIEMLQQFKEHIAMDAQVCVSNENFHEIPLFFQVFKPYFRYDQFSFGFVANLSAEMGVEENYFHKQKIDLRHLVKRPIPCSFFWQQAHVLHDGRVSACCRDYNGDLIMGDLKREGIGEIWKNARYAAYRKAHAQNDEQALPQMCKECLSVDKEITQLFNDFIRFCYLKYAGVSAEDFVKKLRTWVGLLNRPRPRDIGDFVRFLEEQV